MGNTTASAPPDIKLTLDPASVRVPSGYGTYRGHLKVVNDGHVAVTVTPAKIRLSATGQHGCVAGPPAWLTLASAKPFRLAGGDEHTLHYTVHAGSGVNGTAAIVAMAAGPRTAAGTIGGAVGMRVTVGSGSNCARPYSAPASHTSGLPWTLIFALIAAVAFLALVVITGRMRKSRRVP